MTRDELLNEYKAAVRDVAEGRAKEPPRPSEFPDTDDKLAAQWMAAAAEEIASEAGGGSGDSSTMVVTLVKSNNTYSIDKTVNEITSFVSNGGIVLVNDTEKNVILNRLLYSGLYLVFQTTFIETQNYPSIPSDRITLRTLQVYVSNGTCSVSEKHYELTPVS